MLILFNASWPETDPRWRIDAPFPKIKTLRQRQIVQTSVLCCERIEVERLQCTLHDTNSSNISFHRLRTIHPCGFVSIAQIGRRSVQGGANCFNALKDNTKMFSKALPKVNLIQIRIFSTIFHENASKVNAWLELVVHDLLIFRSSLLIENCLELYEGWHTLLQYPLFHTWK